VEGARRASTSGRRGVWVCSPFWAPPENQAAVMFLNPLKGVALTYIEAWPLREIQTWSFDHMVEVPGVGEGSLLRTCAPAIQIVCMVGSMKH
jgi:hypothetical protein